MPLTDATRIPRSTYRIQLHAKFNFADLEALLSYFRDLGISDFYFSPIFLSAPGSSHGYDVGDYRKINPELGGEAGFDRLSQRLRDAGQGVVLDFVPNHMGIQGPMNAWWRDVLENGQHSSHAHFFDIQWNALGGYGRQRVLVPILEDHYGRVLAAGKITLEFTHEFTLSCGDLRFPVNPHSYPVIAQPIVDDASLPTGSREELAQNLAEFSALTELAAPQDPTAARERSRQTARLKQRFAELARTRPEISERLSARLKEINGQPGNEASFATLHALHEQQHYRLVRWKTGAHEINYRRFFAIDSLVGLRMEQPDVFRETHALLEKLLHAGKITGLRIDHIDGLRQPEDYLRRLQLLSRANPKAPLFVLVEKILARNESLPATWPTHGTTGYDFIPQLAALFTDASAERGLTAFYQAFTGDCASYTATIYEKKRLTIEELFANAVTDLGTKLANIVDADRRWRDLTRYEMIFAVRELMANFPVYRTYRQQTEKVSSADRAALYDACARALERNPRADPQPLEFLRDVLTGDYPPDDADGWYRQRLLEWVLTFQQYTGAVMAKSVEDTAFYTYSRLIALNEVGGDPGLFGDAVDSFHQANRVRLETTPHSLFATSTHDTKLSEDVRARLYALSEIPAEWETWCTEWHQLNARHRSTVDQSEAPDALDEYRFYQVLLGAWPLDEAERDDAFRTRLRTHFEKAVAEAKRHTSYLHPNTAYLEACARFADAITDSEVSRAFLAAFQPCAQRVARLGMVNSLAQLVLKCTAPGVPDFYQGCEIWDFSLVDPDNRRPVDYEKRRQLLASLAQRPLPELVNAWRDGGLKLHATRELLRLRETHAPLFAGGDYQPVAAQGAFAGNVVAFTRQLAGKSVLVVSPRLTAKLGAPPLGAVWDDTAIALSAPARNWRDWFTGEIFSAAETIPLRQLFGTLPFAVLETQ
jgi:(1->4)-alpha-D-glucan 1-alpha-D-glucosylmutase